MYYEEINSERPILREVLTERPRYELQQYFFHKGKHNELQIDNNQVHGTHILLDDPVVNRLGINLKPMTEEIFDRNLFPTYTMMRLYRRGDVLPIHIDRPACEYSLSVTVAQSSDANTGRTWSLYVKTPLMGENTEASVVAGLGEGVFYKGYENPHFRNQCPYEWSLHAFFHYVEKGGAIYEYFRDLYPQIDECEMLNLRDTNLLMR